jgi:hypothetical protein
VPVVATQAIHRMRGGAQSQLMLAADGNLWVVKFQNNPQHLRVLANELIATRLAEAAGLTVPKTDVVEVGEWLIAHSAEMFMERGRNTQERCKPGLQFGSRFIGAPPSQVVDYLPEPQMNDLRNLAEFAGMLVVDKWTGNCNGRQAVYERRPRERRYKATFIDQGYCFNAGEWTFPDSPLRGVFARNQVYANVTGWPSFEPWLTRIEEFAADKLWSIAETVPPEWYGGDPRTLEHLMETLLQRRPHVRKLIEAFRESPRDPFPNWGASKSAIVPQSFDLPADAGKFLM